MLENQIKEAVIRAAEKLCESGNLKVLTSLHELNFTVNLPKNPEHGDFATNIAMVLSKPAGQKPRDLALELAAELKKNTNLFENVEVAGPGFINLKLNKQAIYNVIKEILILGHSYGLNKDKDKKRILVEFVSANPTGPIHLGHARGTFLGDAVARLLKAAGNEVTREFYVNDAGKQVRTLGRSVYLRYQELFGKSIELSKGEYPGSYIIDIAKSLKEKDGDKWLRAKEEEAIDYCTDYGIAENLKLIKATLEKANVHFDNWYSEKALHEKNLPAVLIEEYKKLGMVYDADAAIGTENKVRRKESKAAQYTDQQLGGLFLKTSLFGDEEDRILLRKSGEPVYLTADLAYHKEKYDRGFDLMIDVFGADHANHVQRLKAGMSAAGKDPDKLKFLTVQIVRMMRDGKEVRFSKRAGEVEELSDLLDEVGSDVARFVFLMRAANTQFDFDLDQAVKQSNDNPVFYVQYGHARMATLLRRAQSEGKSFDLTKLADKGLARLTLPEELDMIKKVAAYPQIIISAANSLEPHRVIYFCQELIAQFHSYFTKYRSTEKIISEDEELTYARLAMVAAIKQTLFNALDLLGITAPESMHNTIEQEDDDVGE